MKLCYINRKFLPGVGGAQEFASSTVNILKKTGINLDLIVNKKGNKYMPIFFIEALFKILFSKSDIYHTGDGLTAILNPIIKIFKRKPIVTTVLGLDITHKNRLYQKIIIPCVNLSDKIISISEETKKECKKRGISQNKIIVINPGLDLGKYPQSKVTKDKNMMITVGRQVERKGINLFVRGKLNQLMKDNPNLNFHIIGDGPESEKIKETISQSKYKDRIFLHGRISDNEVYNYYLKSKFFVMPNIYVEGDIEGFGLVILEAIFFENIILANPIEGIKDALKYTSNWIDLKKEKIILDDIKYKKESNDLSWDNRIKEYLKIYRIKAFHPVCDWW